ncbi:MAG: HEAT repeat domain-containing protein [Planctomycetes bacterium]|nr:HEAT repeat domain-containing protein [Planctomycetota bacterium]
MTKPFNPSLFLLIILILSLLGGCVAVQRESQTLPLTDEEIEFLKKLDDPKTTSVQVDVPTLFFRLNNLIGEWQNAAVNKNSWKQLKIKSNLGSILTRYVYLNFDKILNELERGAQPNRVTAAAALGFSRIPDNDKFPQVYPRAVQALLRSLESGDDAITQNALLGLAILEVPETPLDLILPLMTRHHNPDVRSNAALCIASVVGPQQSDSVMPYVLPALRDDAPKVRNHAVSIILKLGDRSAINPLIELMDDRYEMIRVNAARALGEMGDLQACGALIKNLTHPKESVRFYAHEALKKLSGKNFGLDEEDWKEWWADAQAGGNR